MSEHLGNIRTSGAERPEESRRSDQRIAHFETESNLTSRILEDSKGSSCKTYEKMD